MIRCKVFDQVWTERQPEQALPGWQSSAAAVLWLDICGEPDDVARHWMSERLALHPLAINDALHPRHPAKAEDFGEVIALIAKSISTATTLDNYTTHFQTAQLVLFVGDRLLVTYSRESPYSVQALWDSEQLAQQPIRIASAILRKVVDRYTPILMQVEERLEDLEDEMFVSQDDTLLEELVNTNTLLKKLRRNLSYHCEAMTEIKTMAMVANDFEATHSFNDVLDHFKRLNSMSQLFQELAVDLINGYLSLSSHRLNKVMKVLTVFTVAFLPLTLLVGIYGMNFENMPELHWHYGYPILLTFMVCVVAVVLGLFKRWKWL